METPEQQIRRFRKEKNKEVKPTLAQKLAGIAGHTTAWAFILFVLLLLLYGIMWVVGKIMAL